MLQSLKQLKASRCDAKQGFFLQLFLTDGHYHLWHIFPCLVLSFKILHIKRLCPSNTVHREIDRSHLNVYRVCPDWTTFKKLSLGEINRCYVQLVVGDYSQCCDKISARAMAVILPTACCLETESEKKPCTQPISLTNYPLPLNCVCSLTTTPFKFPGA